jgi:3-hydroxybutyryl-CoA dehydrogenase
VKPETIREVTIIGAGLMGEGIGLAFAAAGLTVRLVDESTMILDNCLTQMRAHSRLLAEFGIVDENPESMLSRVKTFLSADLDKSLLDSGFVIECIPEILALKRELFSRLDSCQADTILSSNTSSFTISEITLGMRTPGRVVGTHFFMPAHIVPLVEIHRGKDTQDSSVDMTRQLILRIGKKPVIVRKEIPGFIVNRIQAAIAREANYLLELGAVTPEDFDMAATSSYGFRLANLGPLAQADLNGLDTVLRGNTQIYRYLCNATEPSPIIAEKVKKGDLGLKSGKGYYDYRGASKERVTEKVERNLLKQLILFRERENQT